jgi:hypothetical protein
MYLFIMSLYAVLCIAANGQAQAGGSALAGALTALNPPCWLDWVANEALLPDPRYTPEVWRLDPKNLNEVKRKAALYPGKLWLFWNEPERGDQADTSPALAASLTLSYTQAVAGHGTWACCGNLIDGNGLAWLDAYLAHGGQVPDIWHIHIYSTSDVAEWNSYLNYWWVWWDAHGAGRPVIISETSLMWQPAAQQAALIHYLMRYDDPRVGQIYWFSTFFEPSVPSWRESHLLNADFTKTALGQVYAPDVTPTATAQATPSLPTNTPALIPTAPAPATPSLPTNTPAATPTPTEQAPGGQALTPTPTEIATVISTPVAAPVVYRLYLPFLAHP